MTLAGIDVSRHQGYIDWPAVARAKDFAFVKATDDVRYAYIGWFRENWPRLRATPDIVPGAYHWLTNADPVAQARYFVAELGNTDGVLCALDVEKDTDGTFPTISVVRGFADEFKRLTNGHPLIVYSGAWFWKGYLGNPRGVDLGPLWHAEYETSQAEVDDGPELESYGGWPFATFWQYTSSGTCPGVSGAVDLDVFYGRHEDLAALARRPALTTTSPEAPDMYVLDCEGKPALVIGVDGVKQINQPQRNALKALGVPVKRNDDVANYEALWSLRSKDIDVKAIAVAVAAEVGGNADATLVEAVMRRVLAETEVQGHLTLAQT